MRASWEAAVIKMCSHLKFLMNYLLVIFSLILLYYSHILTNQ